MYKTIYITHILRRDPSRKSTSWVICNSIYFLVDYFSDVYVCVGIIYMSRFSEEVSLASSIHACMVEYSENPKPILTNEGQLIRLYHWVVLGFKYFH